MVKHISSVLCERISKDIDETFSFITCIDGISASRVPCAIPKLALGIKWFNYGNKEQKLQSRIEIVKPDGQIVQNAKETVLESIIKPLRSHRDNVILNGMPIDQFGIYKFLIFHIKNKQSELVAEIPLSVTEIQKEKSIKLD
jgi:hypothetical protein